MPGIMHNAGGNPRVRQALGVLAVAAALVLSGPATADEVADLLAAEDVRPGLCVYLGASSADRAVALHGKGKFLVHGLSTDRTAVAEMRNAIHDAGLYGRVSVEYHDLKRLPHVDNIVNAFVVDDFAALQRGGLTIAELLRALTPYGTAFLQGADLGQTQQAVAALGDDAPTVRQVGGWIRIDKPFPKAMDSWNQYAHDAARTFTSRDTLAGPLQSVRWIAGEVLYTGRYSSPNIISAGGRVFLNYKDRGYKGCVEGRDAFNGRLLWKTPAQEGVRDFIADGRRIYVLKDTLQAWDAATGKLLFKFKHPRVVWHRLLFDEKAGVIVILCGLDRWVRGFDATTGKELWKRDGLTKAYNVGLGVLGGDRLYYSHQQDEGEGDAKRSIYSIKGVDVQTGRQVFEARDIFGQPDVAPTIAQFLDGKLIVIAPLTKMAKTRRTDVISVATGRSLWNTQTDPGIVKGGGFFHLNELFWTREGKLMVGFDPETGEVKRCIEPKRGEHIHMGCDPMAATTKYFVGGRMHFIDPDDGKIYRHAATRTPCRDASRIANGLTYFPRHTCACANQMNGNIAASHTSVVPAEPATHDDPSRFQKGPAFGATLAKATGAGWPTYRANPLRGGVVAAQISASLVQRWDARIGRSASAPVAVGDRAYAAAVEEHAVAALDAADGRELWRFVTGARVDSPPTIHRELALFGSRDGWVYCLRSSDGALVWRFRAAPDERRIVVHEQVESVWPVFGSVLVEGGLVYASAGRHVDIDGGLWIYALDPATGRVVWQNNVRNPAYKIESAISSRLRGEGAINDILRSDGRHLYLAGSFEKVAFDLKTGKRVPAAEGIDLRGVKRLLKEGAPGVKTEPEAAQAKTAPVHTVTGAGFVTNWLILGPFPSQSLGTDFLAGIGGEAAAQLTPGMKLQYKLPTGEAADARTGPATANAGASVVRLQDPTTDGKTNSAYAFCWLRSDKARMLRGIYGSGGGGQRIWINGKLVCRREPERRTYQKSQDIFPVPLRAGMNAILVKIGESHQGLAFFFALTDAPPAPVLSTAGDMLLPAKNRALTGHWGDPTNASVIWVFSPDQERAGIPFHHKGGRFDLVDEWGYAADLMVFDGYRVFGVGREQDAKRTKLALFGRPSWSSKVWFAELAHDVADLRAMLIAGDIAVTAFDDTAEVKEGAVEPKGLLLFHSVADGSALGRLALPDVPRWDGMAATSGRLFVATESGRVVCLTAPRPAAE
jgi:outer membrane protein assembly factor BamB